MLGLDGSSAGSSVYGTYTADEANSFDDFSSNESGDGPPARLVTGSCLWPDDEDGSDDLLPSSASRLQSQSKRVPEAELGLDTTHLSTWSPSPNMVLILSN